MRSETSIKSRTQRRKETPTGGLVKAGKVMKRAQSLRVRKQKFKKILENFNKTTSKKSTNIKHIIYPEEISKLKPIPKYFRFSAVRRKIAVSEGTFGITNKKGKVVFDTKQFQRSCGQMWRNLSIAEKAPYVKAYDDDNAKFLLAKANYEKNTPLDQRVLKEKPSIAAGSANIGSLLELIGNEVFALSEKTSVLGKGVASIKKDTCQLKLDLSPKKPRRQARRSSRGGRVARQEKKVKKSKKKVKKAKKKVVKSKRSHSRVGNKFPATQSLREDEEEEDTVEAMEIDGEEEGEEENGFVNETQMDEDDDDSDSDSDSDGEGF